jgi:lysophospholipase L1-like esterase
LIASWYGRPAVLAVVVSALSSLVACGSSPTSPPQTNRLTLTCPAPVEGQSPDGEPVAVTFGSPMPNGGTPPVNLSCSPASGSLFPGGTNVVVCMATDSAGMTATCSTSVFVRLPPRLIGTKFLAFGDSITSGRYSDPVRSLIVNGGIAYSTLLEARLKSEYPDQASAIEVVNEGIPGDTAQEAVESRRFEEAIQRYRPEILLLMMGTNDILSPDGVNRGAEALRQMIVMATSEPYNARVVLATIPPQRAGVPPLRPVPHLVPVINERIRELALQMNVPLADVYKVMEEDLSLIGEDNLHPTPAGMQAIADAFFEAIRNNLEVPQPAAQGIR